MSPSPAELHLKFDLGDRIIAAAIVLLVVAGCHRGGSPSASRVETASAQTQDIVINVEATGIIEPVDAVQVKSKASGQIVQMPVVVGSNVGRDDLLVQVDPRQMQSQYDAAVAALKAAQDNLAAQQIELTREDSMFRQRVVTAQEHEGAVVAYSSARSAVANAEMNVQVSQINLTDATVRAPVAGTVIDKSVSLGQVIASATNVVGGGTTLVTIADLSHVLDSALVNESDVGRVQVGQDVNVMVAAYPNQTFHGIVTRISPEAIIQQSVTMFPVLIALDNGDRRLLPGMNSDATINVTRINDALTVPNDAIASPQEARQLARVLGATQAAGDSAMRGGRGRGRGGRLSFASNTTVKRDTTTSTSRRAVVFVQDTATRHFALRPVTISDGNYDVTRVVNGLHPGERVALLSDVRVAAARDSTLQRVQGRSGISGMMNGGPGGGRGGGGGGGAGGAGAGAR